MKKTKLSRRMSSIIIFLIVFSIIIGAVTWGIVSLISESTNLLQTLNLYIDRAYTQIQLPIKITAILTICSITWLIDGSEIYRCP